jgi:hypothetical protein
MKFKEFLEKNAPLNQLEHKQLNFKVFFWALGILGIFYVFAILYFTYTDNKEIFYPMIEQMKERYEFFKTRYEDTELMIPGAGMMYFLSIFFSFFVAIPLGIIYIFTYIKQSLNRDFHPIGWKAIFIALFWFLVSMIPVYMSFVKKIDFFDPLKKADRLYIGFPNVILSLISIIILLSSILIIFVVVIKIIRQRGRLINAK